MCGRLNITDDPSVRALCETLEIDLWPEQGQVFQRYLGAASTLSIVRNKNNQRVMENAIWWLLLQPTESGFKPSRYTSINTRYDSLNNPRKAGYKPFRHSRIVIPVKGFGESEYRSGKLLHCHDMQAQEGALLMAGLCKEWRHATTGETALSCSIITLPPHPKLHHIHSKSTPMMFPQDSNLINAWLDEHNQQVADFEPLLHPYIYQTLEAQQIVKPSQYQQHVGAKFSIEADA